MIVKLFLIGSVIAAGMWLLRTPRGGNQVAVVRLLGLLFCASWVVAVIAPESVTWLANRVGVGRGADLLLYLLVVAFMFATLGHYKRLRTMEDRLADLTRASALLEHEVENLRERSY